MSGGGEGSDSGLEMRLGMRKSSMGMRGGLKLDSEKLR